MFRRAILTAFSALAGLSAAVPVSAETFKCPHVGGNFTFGQEANINSLDQMTSGTISTRNIAMNMFESLMTRDENFNPILELADSMAETPDHLTYTFKLRQGVAFPQRQGDDLGRRGRLVRPLRQDRPLSQLAGQRRSLGRAGQIHLRDPS